MEQFDFYKNHSDADEVRKGIRHCMKAMAGYLVKLQKDGYIRPEDNISYAEVLLKEMFTGICAVYYETMGQSMSCREVCGKLYLLISDWTGEVFSFSREEFLAGIMDWCERKKEGESTAQLFQAYGVLCRFDQMAQEYSGAFYTRMGVDNPGRISEFYYQLLDAVTYLLCEFMVYRKDGNNSCESFRHSTELLKSELKEMELEFLE